MQHSKKKKTKLVLAPMEFQQFRENHGKMCTQIIEYTEKTVYNFRQGLLPVTPRNISHGENDPGSLTLVEGHHKNLEITVAFLFGKSVS